MTKPITEPIESADTVTLEHVARAAGVSPATVSRILNGTAKVSARRRAMVEEAIKTLKYRPNALARGLAQGRTNSIGVLTQDIASPFYGEALRGIEAALANSGVVPLFASGHWILKDEIQRMEHLLSRKVDGVIVLTGRLSDDQLAGYAGEVPIVVTGRDVAAANLTSLRVDDFHGARLATQHLIEGGHSRIAHLAGPQDHADSVERLRGYRVALEEAGLPFDPALVVQADFHEAGGMLAAKHLLASGVPFSAVFASNDQTAFGVRLALFTQGIRVPEDVSIVGFDDLPVSSYMVPPLTTVKQPVYEMGRIAAQALMNMIAGRPVAFSLPRPEIVIRGSTRALRR